MGEVKEPARLLECEVANSTLCKVYTPAQSLKKNSLNNSEKSNLISFIILALKILFIIQKNPLIYNKYLNCITRKHTVLRVSVRENYHLQGDLYTNEL
jgi:hypothetical protein